MVSVDSRDAARGAGCSRGAVARAAACGLLVMLIGAAVPCARAASALDGGWVVNEDLSVDPDDAFDDKLERDSYPVPYAEPGPNQATSPRDVSQSNYWETVRAGKERNSLKNLRRLGSAYPLVMARRVDIKPDDKGFEIVYDEVLPRGIRVNPKGRVFSASGDELTSDSLGFTLAYWEKDALVLETDPPDGGKVYERFRMYDNPRQLEYVIRLEMRILKEPVEFKRVLDPVNAGH